MAKFKKSYQLGEIEIPTSALPDIIFMLLFFFMVTTVLKEKEDKVKYLIPDAEQIKKIEKKSLVTEVIIGYPKQSVTFGSEAVIQANGRIIQLSEVPQFIEESKSKLSEFEKDQLIVLLKVDKDVEMGIVTDVQQELRKANARKVVYASLTELKK